MKNLVIKRSGKNFEVFKGKESLGQFKEFESAVEFSETVTDASFEVNNNNCVDNANFKMQHDREYAMSIGFLNRG